jgi:hypothetical protein
MTLSSLGKFRVWQLLSFYQFQERIPKKKLIAAIVKPMLQFIQICIQLLCRKFVIRPHDRTLKQTPHVLDAVNNHISQPFAAMLTSEQRALVRCRAVR